MTAPQPSTPIPVTFYPSTRRNALPVYGANRHPSAVCNGSSVPQGRAACHCHAPIGNGRTIKPDRVAAPIKAFRGVLWTLAIFVLLGGIAWLESQIG